MQAQTLIVIAFLGFLLLAGGSLARSVRRARDLCGELARRLPERYEALGRPRPGFFDHPRRHAYMRFIMQSVYLELGDPYLVEQFGELRRSEVRQLVFLLLGFAALGVAALWYEFLRAP